MAYFDNFFEFEKFDGPHAAQVFQFNAGDLTLKPYALHSWDGTVVTEMSAASAPISGTPFPAAQLGLADTSALWLGRVVANVYGNYAARVAAFDATNVTLVALNGATGQPLAWVNATPGQKHLVVWTVMTAVALNGAGRCQRCDRHDAGRGASGPRSEWHGLLRGRRF